MSYANRQFSHCNVSWVITSCCKWPFHGKWKITSPEFLVDGHAQTKWRMSLMNHHDATNNEIAEVEFQLKRIKHKGGGGLWTHYRLYLFNGTEEPEREDHQKMMHPGESRLTPLKIVFPFSDNPIELLLQLIVWTDQEVREPIADCDDVSLRQLSRDMETICDADEDYDYDTEIKIYHLEKYHVHRSILCERIKNPEVKDDVWNNECVIRFENFRYDSMDRVVRFLYNADMARAVSSPQLYTYDLAKEFGVQPIMTYFQPDILNMHTETQLESFGISWTIQGFSSRKAFLAGPAVSGELYHGVLQLFPDANKTYGDGVRVEVEIELKVARKVCLKLLLETENDTSHLIKKYEFNDQLSFKFHETIRRGQLYSPIPEDGHVTLQLNVSMTLCTEESSMGKSLITRKPYCDQQNYIDLSKDMLSVYEKTDFKTYYHRTIQLHNRMADILNTHRYIIKARNSDFVATLFDDPEYRMANLIKLETLDQVLQYLFCGKFTEKLDLEDVAHLHEVAERCEFHSLKHALESNLIEYVFDDIIAVFNFATSRNLHDVLAHINGRLNIENL